MFAKKITIYILTHKQITRIICLSQSTFRPWKSVQI